MTTITTTEADDAKDPLEYPTASTDAFLPPSSMSEKPAAPRRGVKAGFAKDLFAGKDMNALLDTSIEDAFEGYL